MDEHVGLGATHRLVQRHAAAIGVDAPALPDAVAGERKHTIAIAGGRCGLERALARNAVRAQVRQILEEHSIGNPLTRRQIAQVDARREVGRLHRRGTYDAPEILERRCSQVLDDHARGTIGAAPHDRTAVRTSPVATPQGSAGRDDSETTIAGA